MHHVGQVAEHKVDLIQTRGKHTFQKGSAPPPCGGGATHMCACSHLMRSSHAMPVAPHATSSPAYHTSGTSSSTVGSAAVDRHL